jgi:hypothetical protein
MYPVVLVQFYYFYRRAGFKPGSGHVGFCDGQKWRWGRFSPRTSVSPANNSTNFSIIIITRDCHNRPISDRSVEWAQLDSTPIIQIKKIINEYNNNKNN